MEIYRILKKAKTICNNPDAIIDTYDLTFVWVSEKCCKLTEYLESELNNNQIFIVYPRYKDTCEIELSMQTDPPKERIIPIITKSKQNIKFKLKSWCFKIDDYPYVVGKIIDVVK